MTEEQRRDAPQIRDFATEGKPIAALAACTAALVALPLASAHAHEAHSRETNNRSLALTPMRDRVRMAYTVFLGEVPGARARQRMDTSRDGIIDDEEAAAYAGSLADSVRQNLQITVDGKPQPLTWDEIHTGLGMAVTNTGALSVDLIGWLCLTEGTTPHTFALRDRFRMPSPGETELRVQESPGVAIVRSSLGMDRGGSAAGAPGGPRLAFQWHGGEVPLATQGYTLAFTVDPQVALMPAGGTCGAPAAQAARGHGRSRAAAVLAATVLVLALVGVALRRMRRRRRKGQ